jgi:hypothetical protein
VGKWTRLSNELNQEKTAVPAVSVKQPGPRKGRERELPLSLSAARSQTKITSGNGMQLVKHHFGCLGFWAVSLPHEM